MQTYREQAEHVAVNCSLVVEVFLAEDFSDMEFLRLKPALPAESHLTAQAEFERRKLRSVGVIGCSGLTPMSALSEPLPENVVDTIASAFTTYVDVIVGQHFATHGGHA